MAKRMKKPTMKKGSVKKGKGKKPMKSKNSAVTSTLRLGMDGKKAKGSY
jgi:hypothetical protein